MGHFIALRRRRGLHLPDRHLGKNSVREVVLARDYAQNSEVSAKSDGCTSVYGFTGEMQASGWVHLRARYFDRKLADS
jgi:hypothetical protein